MAFNHYVKIARLLVDQPEGWIIKRINTPTSAINFKGEVVYYPYHYRIFDTHDRPIKYAKFQQLDRLARTLGVDSKDLPVINEEN